MQSIKKTTKNDSMLFGDFSQYLNLNILNFIFHIDYILYFFFCLCPRQGQIEKNFSTSYME